MPSASPSPGKRPSLTERTSSAHSLSSSGKPAAGQKPRPHYVSRHSRNVSHGKGLSKLGKVNSMANVYGDARNHQRKKSGPTTPSASPKASMAAQIKRNSSHVVLPKNTSHVNLRKNKSSNALTAMNRNISQGALKKLGAPPNQKPEIQDSKQGVFDLGNQSSEEEDEEDWEDSTTQSPEVTRDNSKASTPARPRTPNGEPIKRLPDPPRSVAPEKSSSPPEPSPLKTNNRSAPNLRQQQIFLSEQPALDPALLYQNERSSRAPPAVSIATARANSGQLKLTDISREFATPASQDPLTPDASFNASGPAQSSSTGSAGVSHFLDPGSVPSSRGAAKDESDDDSPSTFMSDYRPQVSDSPEKSRSMLNKARVPTVPSRTQQKLELQRREALRGAPTTASTPPASSIGVSVGSSVSLHSRSGSKGRSRMLAGETGLLKQDYETAIKQLTILRRFRNPILESLTRLKDSDALPSEIGTLASTGQSSKGGTQSQKVLTSATNGNIRTPAGTSPEDRKPSTLTSRSSSQARGSKVHFQMSRQRSHDDILTASRDSPEAHHDEQDGISPEEALIRRMWDSRVEVGA